MKVKGLTLEELEACARAAGHFKLDNVRSKGNYHFFVLRMASGTPSKREREWHEKHPEARDLEGPGGTASHGERMKYRKRSFGRMAWGRGPEYGVAVCFHGFRAFMYEVFEVNPKAIIRTAKAAYLSKEDFEAKWPGVGTANVGSMACPIRYEEACDC